MDKNSAIQDNAVEEAIVLDRQNNVVGKIIMALLAVDCLLLFLSLMEIGQMKISQFVLGEVAMATAIAYSFQAGRGADRYAPFEIVVWSFITSIIFMRAIW